MKRSEALFNEAKSHLVGGVNSAVRAYTGVGGTPPVIREGHGAWIRDEDNREYVDYVLSYGPLAVGHSHPRVVSAVQDSVAKGTSFGAPTELETRMAVTLKEMVPSVEMVRLVNSGTEACMSAVRLARGYTGRDLILKFQGNYHGHVDSLLVQAGSGVATLGIPGSPGVPEGMAATTLSAPFNDLEAAKRAFQQHGDRIAAVIVEPVAGNISCVPSNPGFLEGLRSLCDAHESVLIFDEVMSGFRAALGGAQEHYGVTPDLTCLGKVIGGGMPVGAVGGRKAVMDYLSPVGPVYQAGTLSGNPAAMTAGLTTLELLREPGVYEAAVGATEHLLAGMRERAEAAGIPLTTNQAGTMMGIFFTDADSVSSFDDVAGSDTERFKRFFHGMLAEGVYLAPSPFEAGFVSTAHDEAAIQHTLDAASRVFAKL